MRAERPNAARIDGEAGTSIVEAIVATMLLAVGVLAVVASLGAASKATATGDHRTIAARLAAGELEAARAIPYDDLGIAVSSRGYVSRFEGRLTVTTGRNAVVALSEQLVDPTEYTIRRHVTWAPIQAGPTRIAQGYKLVTVIVTWTDATGPHQLRQDTGVYGTAP